MMQSKLAVVILNYNGKRHLETFLPSVIQFSKPHQIVVADNCSTDNSIKFIEDNFHEIQILKNDENGGFAKGYNDALKKLEGSFDYYLLLNSDVQVTPNWIEPLLDELNDQNLAACQPKILSYADKTKFEHAGAAGGFIDEDYFPFCRGRIFEETEKDNGQYDYSTEITWTSGAAMLIRSDLFHSVNGFDEHFFAHMEEIDLCLRLGKKGYKFSCNSASTVFHLGGGTLPYKSAAKVYLNFRNNLFMLVKNHPGWLFPKLFKRMTLDGIAAFKFLTEGKFSFFWKVFLSHMQLYLNLPRLLKQRAELKIDHHSFKKYHGSILWAYFIQKNNHFSKLNSRKFEL
jgi:GT2 family glycosyltransferase